MHIFKTTWINYDCSQSLTTSWMRACVLCSYLSSIASELKTNSELVLQTDSGNQCFPYTGWELSKFLNINVVLNIYLMLKHLGCDIKLT